MKTCGIDRMIMVLLLTLCFSCSNEDNYTYNEQSVKDKENGCILIVPDIQYYTNTPERFVYLESMLQWMTTHKDEDNVRLSLQVGDVTYQNTMVQWENANNYFFSKIPQDIPTAFCLGNHDYGESGLSQQRISNIPSYLKAQKSFEKNGTQYDNYGRFINIGTVDYCVLVLEFAPRNETLAWADEVIKSNPDVRFIILTHAFLNNEGQLFDATDDSRDNKYSQKYYTMGGDYLNDSKEIFDKIIYNNTNVKMVICGHCVSDNYIEYNVQNNINGDEVHCIMVNYQHYTEGGAGNVGILYYNKNKYRLRSFSTVNNTFGSIDISFENN